MDIGGTKRRYAGDDGLFAAADTGRKLRRLSEWRALVFGAGVVSAPNKIQRCTNPEKCCCCGVFRAFVFVGTNCLG